MASDYALAERIPDAADPWKVRSPMRLVLATLTILTAAFAPLPALASSGAERIGTIEQRLDRAGAVQVFGLQAGLTLRTGSAGGMRATRHDAPNDPARVSTAEGVGHASSLLDHDADADRRGDRGACENPRRAVKGMIGTLS
ncbi:hypothetical protein P5712_00080 [Methylobacterium fujisawaense]|jgi:hypothetical protein|nr:hypothetical protein [Methylobacterium fujisawaense]